MEIDWKPAMKSMMDVIIKSVTAFLNKAYVKKDEDLKGFTGGCFGLLIKPDNTEEYYIGSFPEILSDAMEHKKENTFSGDGREGDFLLKCLDIADKDCILKVFGFPKDEFKKGYADKLINQLLHSRDYLTRFMGCYFSECRLTESYPDLEAYERIFGSFGFGYTLTTAALNDLEAKNSAYHSVMYLNRIREDLEKALSNNTDTEYAKFAKEQIDDIDAVLKKKGKTIEEDFYYENKRLIDSYQERENSYVDGVIGHWYSSRLDDAKELTICGNSKLMIANLSEFNLVISFAVRNAVEHKNYIKRCSFCKAYIYTAKKRYPHFCCDDCRKAYHKEYSRIHQKSYKKYKLMDRDYENLRKFVRRHIKSAKSDEVKTLLIKVLEELSEEGIKRKNAANANEKYNPEWEVTPQEEFYAYGKEIREKVKKIEGGII